MSDHNQDLATEFPAFKDLIHELKTSDAHFRRLFDNYHELNKRIHRAADRIEVMSEQEEESLRKERLRLKDEMYSLLKSAQK